MNTQTQSRPVFAEQLQGKVGELMDRVTSEAPGAERSRLLRRLLLAGAPLVGAGDGGRAQTRLWSPLRARRCGGAAVRCGFFDTSTNHDGAMTDG